MMRAEDWLLGGSEYSWDMLRKVKRSLSKTISADFHNTYRPAG